MERSFDLTRYAAVQRHWLEVAPPAHLSLAAMIGFKPGRAAQGGEVIDDPEDLAAQLRAMGVLG